jgi:hypothetical protein
MAVFSLSRPQSMYATEPQYATGAEKAGLAFRGYKATGEQNTFGKIMSWTPALGLAQNLMARNYAQKIGATDAWENIKEDTDNRLMKQGVLVGATLMAAGGILAAPAIGGALGGAGAGAAGAAGAAGSTAALGGVAGAAGGASAAATAAAGATGAAGIAGAAGAGSTALTAGTELFKGGLNMTSNFAGMLAFDQDDGTTDDSNYIYR